MKAMARIPAVISATGTPLNGLGDVLQFEPLADTGEQHQRQCEADGRRHGINDALQQVELLVRSSGSPRPARRSWS